MRTKNIFDLNILKRTYTIILLSTFLLFLCIEITLLFKAEFWSKYKPQLFFGYLFFYLLILLAFLFCLLLISAVLKKNSISALKELKWIFFYSVSFILFFKFSLNLNKWFHIGSEVKTYIKNSTNETVEDFVIYGRHNKTEVAHILPKKDTLVLFYGKSIDYDTQNPNENSVEINFTSAKFFTQKEILNNWRVISDSLSIEIIKKDSIKVEVW